MHEAMIYIRLLWWEIICLCETPNVIVITDKGATESVFCLGFIMFTTIRNTVLSLFLIKHRIHTHTPITPCIVKANYYLRGITFFITSARLTIEI